MLRTSFSFKAMAAGMLASTMLIVSAHAQEVATGSTNVAVIPDADLFIRVDLASMRDTAIYDKFKELREADGKPAVQAEDMKEMAEQLKSITGLTDKDFQKIVVSAVLKDLDLEAGNYKQATDNLNGAMAIQVAKSVTLDQLEEAARKATAEKEDVEVGITRDAYKGRELLVLTSVKDGQEEQPMAVTTSADGKVIILGSMPGIRGAFDRSASGQVVAASDALGLPNDKLPQIAVRFDLTEQMREKMRQQNPQEQPPQGGNPMAGVAAAFRNLEQVKAFVTMADDAKVMLSLGVGSVDSAQQAKGVLDNQVLSMLRMMATTLVGGQPLDVLNTLKTVADPKGSVQLSFALTAADIEKLQKAGMKGPGARGPRGVPGDAPTIQPSPAPNE